MRSNRDLPSLQHGFHHLALPKPECSSTDFRPRKTLRGSQQVHRDLWAHPTPDWSWRIRSMFEPMLFKYVFVHIICYIRIHIWNQQPKTDFQTDCWCCCPPTNIDPVIWVLNTILRWMKTRKPLDQDEIFIIFGLFLNRRKKKREILSVIYISGDPPRVTNILYHHLLRDNKKSLKKGIAKDRWLGWNQHQPQSIFEKLRLPSDVCSFI